MKNTIINKNLIDNTIKTFELCLSIIEVFAIILFIAVVAMGLILMQQNYLIPIDQILNNINKIKLLLP